MLTLKKLELKASAPDDGAGADYKQEKFA